MNTTELELPIELKKLRSVLIQHGVVSAFVFGSYARGDARPDSDLDLLVTYGDDVSLFDHLNLREALKDIVGKSVDVVSARSVSKYFAPYINRDKVTIL